MDEDRSVPLKANDPDPSKLTLDEQALPDDNGLFHDQLYPALRNKPRIVYVPDSYNGAPSIGVTNSSFMTSFSLADDSPFFQAKMIKENPENPGELLEVEVRGKKLHMVRS